MAEVLLPVLGYDPETMRGDATKIGIAGAKLADHGTIDLFPRRHVRQLWRLPCGTTCVQLTGRQQHIHLALVQIDADAITGLQQCQATPHRRFGRYVQNRR